GFHNIADFTQESPFLTCIDYIFIDEKYSHCILEVQTRYGNSDYLLLECSLNFDRLQKRNSQWSFQKENLKNKKLHCEILKKLKCEESVQDWDNCKINIQSITRAFRIQKRPEDEIAKLNKRLTMLKTLQAKTNRGARWAEKGERSMRYFFACFKNRQSK
ncbi:524_t:CDS:2, partial [Gigaspora rosea]